MTPRVEELRDGKPVARQRLTRYQAAAIVVWLLGVGTTYQVIGALWETTWYAVLIAAFVAQALLTTFESPALTGRPEPVSVAVLALDVLINAGGVFLVIYGRLERVPAVQMAGELTGQDSLSVATVAVVSLVLGLIIAAAPEAGWRWRAR